MDKRVANADAAIAKLKDGRAYPACPAGRRQAGATVLMCGFGLSGIPENLIAV
jgi:acyl CoA:acetate/3-ketoacid CoA transferase alpha subunit